MKVIYYNSPIGTLKISSVGEKICGIESVKKVLLENKDGHHKNVETVSKEYFSESSRVPKGVLRECVHQLEEYFLRQRKKFHVPLQIEGTDFQKKVWERLIQIPYGQKVAYGHIAKEIGNPKGARAVGGANNKNKIMILIPCHRVIGSKGNLVGYAGGLKMKEYLLELECREMRKRATEIQNVECR